MDDHILDHVIKKKNIVKLDPRTKFILLLIAMSAYLQSIPSTIIAVFIILGIALVILSGHPKTALKYTIIFIVIQSINQLTSFMPHWLNALWGVFSLSFQFFLPILIYVMLLIYTSSINDVSTVLEKLRTPQFIAIPILVMMRFLPTIGEEYHHIRNAMVFRGIGIGFKNIIKHPVKTIEYIYVPLLFSLVRIGEELTMSSLTRGLGLYKKRTRMQNQNMTLQDYAILILYTLLYCYGFYLKRGIL